MAEEIGFGVLVIDLSVFCFDPGWFALIIFGLMIPVEVMGAYVIYRYTDMFETYLPTCKVVSDYKKVFSNYGFWGKSVRAGSIGMVLMIPRLYARRGLVDLDEVGRFPIKWRRVLVTLNVLLFFLFGAMFVFSGWESFYNSHC